MLRSCLSFRIALIIMTCSLVLSAAYGVYAQTQQPRSLTTEDYEIAELNPPKTEAVQGENQWTRTSTLNAPPSAYEPTGIWTGSEMIVWGGGTPDGAVNTGGRYYPAYDQWQLLSTIDAPSPRQRHVAVWTGKEMIVWGGHNSGTATNTGGRYNLATDQWTAMSVVNAPPAEPGASPHQCGYKAVWTGEEMIVWGVCGSVGGRYNPATNQWRTINTTNAPAVPPIVGFSEPALALVWTGTEAIVYYPAPDNQMTGGRYDPVTDSWRPMSLVNAPQIAVQPAVVWTGKDMMVYGGNPVIFGGPAHGAYYAPSADAWTTIPNDFLGGNLAVWTGNEVVVLNGSGSNDGLDTARYDLARNQWLYLPHYSCYVNLMVPFGSAVWTGSEVLLWGGGICGGYGEPYGGLRLRLRDQYSDSITLGADTYIASGHPTESFGSDPILFSGWDPQYGYGAERVLVRFLYGLPSRFSVTQASTSLYLYAYNRRADYLPTSVHRITADWNESSATWQNMANNYDPTPVATLSIGTKFTWQTFDVTSLVQSWSAGTPNYGFMFITPAAGDRNERVYLAKEAGSYYPILNVSYVDSYYAGDSSAPSAFITSASPVQPADFPLRVQWGGLDTGRGVQNYDVQVQDGAGGTWADWLAWAVGKQAHFTGTTGHTYCFRVRARDYANNIGAWSTENNCTYFGTGPLIGQTFDQRHQPISSASFAIAPDPVTTTVNSWTGQSISYWTAAQSVQIDVSHTGYVSPPTAQRTVTTATHYDGILQPADNVILNPNFENDLAGSWSITGTLPTSRTSQAHSGNSAVALNSDIAPGAGLAAVSQSIQVSAQDPHQTLSFLYALTTTQPLSSTFKVSLTAGETITDLYTTDQPCSSWCHQWLDLDAWSGQTITLTFSLVQSGGAIAHANLDEVTLGSWVTPIIDDATPRRVPAHAATAVTVTGDNFVASPSAGVYLAGPIVLLDNIPVETHWINTTTLTATVPMTLPFGTYRLSVQNPSGQQGTWTDAFYVGSTTYLPLMMKNGS